MYIFRLQINKYHKELIIHCYCYMTYIILIVNAELVSDEFWMSHIDFKLKHDQIHIPVAHDS